LFVFLESIEAEFANPWVESGGTNELDPLPTWSADFANDPFSGSENETISRQQKFVHNAIVSCPSEAELQDDFATNLPNTSSPKREEEEEEQ